MTTTHPETEAARRRPIDYLAIEQEARRLRAEAFGYAFSTLVRRLRGRPAPKPAQTPDGKLA